MFQYNVVNLVKFHCLDSQCPPLCYWYRLSTSSQPDTYLKSTGSAACHLGVWYSDHACSAHSVLLVSDVLHCCSWLYLRHAGPSLFLLLARCQCITVEASSLAIATPVMLVRHHAPRCLLSALCTWPLGMSLTTRQQNHYVLYPDHPIIQPLQYANNLHYAPLVGIGSGHRQLIAVTCIAEHA